jgi:hypothetical protein
MLARWLVCAKADAVEVMDTLAGAHASRPCVFRAGPYQTPVTHIAHGRASTDKLLKNHGCRGSRHNGGYNRISPLILLMFFDQNIPCAMVLRLIS